ncbi:NADH dehydrogenase [ubiquinone] 1 alpha subcomplex subunit 11 isoform X1 [Cynocephalus volans]|uniref:NADH dehydrogenase [ubiquinone] 1 alpha subcomplex subunit 11 isoform X1 n=1 Tax=Cynocephalus volans TaxID=110931 RepID=UPI002FCB15D1
MARRLFQQYSDIPEGTECHRKAYVSTAIGGAVGLTVSAYSVALNPADSILEGVARVGRYTFTAGLPQLPPVSTGKEDDPSWGTHTRRPAPGLGAGCPEGQQLADWWRLSPSKLDASAPSGTAIGAMFGLTSCISAQVREKPDDPLNYFIGGCAGGLTLGARTHSYGIAASSCVYMGAAAALFKMGQLEGWDVFAKPKM